MISPETSFVVFQFPFLCCFGFLVFPLLGCFQLYLVSFWLRKDSRSERYSDSKTDSLLFLVTAVPRKISETSVLTPDLGGVMAPVEVCWENADPGSGGVFEDRGCASNCVEEGDLAAVHHIGSRTETLHWTLRVTEVGHQTVWSQRPGTRLCV